MTSKIDDARFTFTAKSPAGSTPPADEPGIITIGKRKFRVTVEMQIDGVWKKVNTSHLLNQNSKLLELAIRCYGIYGATTRASEIPSSLTVYFDKNNKTESFTSRTLGKIFNPLKEDVALLEFKKLEYKAIDGDPVEVFDLESESLEHADAMEVHDHLKALDSLARTFYNNKQRLTAKPKKIKPAADPASSIIDQCIVDAGAQGNRCAALSLAKMELEKNTIEEITEKYGLDKNFPQAFNSSATKRETLAEELVKKAADNIAKPNSEFLDENEDEQHPSLASIKTAIREETRTEPTGTPQEIVQGYAAKIRKPGEMLDLPFFLALEQPFIIIHKPTTSNEIMVLGPEFDVPGRIEDCDFEDVNILFYNSSDHYQAVKLDTDEKKEAMRELVRRALDARIEGLITRLSTKDVGIDAQDGEQRDALNLFDQYRGAQKELIERLQRLYPDQLTAEVIEYLDDAPNIPDFISRLRNAIHDDL